MTVLRGQNYYWFLMFRTMVGIGEASYSTIAPTIISDMFVQDMRSKMLALFYFAIPVGRWDNSSQVAYSSQVVGASRRSVCILDTAFDFSWRKQSLRLRYSQQLFPNQSFLHNICA